MMTPLTSELLRKRGSCCKSNCLHCPFGTTLKNIGVKKEKYSEKNQLEIKELMNKLVFKDDVTQNLLGAAFGKTENYDIKDSYLLTLKDIPCGLLFLKNSIYQKHFLLDAFNDQGIDETYIRGLL